MGDEIVSIMHRFFIPPDWLKGEEVTIKGQKAHQIRNVLRLRVGDHILVLDDSGWEREVEIIEISHEEAIGRVVRRSLSHSEPRTKVSLYQGVLKGRRFEIVLQKGTELGIVEFIPIICERCIIADMEDVSKKTERWRRIISEAAEQSGRGKLPKLQPAMLFQQACERAMRSEGLSLIPWEGERRRSLRSLLGDRAGEAMKELRNLIGVQSFPYPHAPRPFSVNLFIGPEGGFTPAEVALARNYGIIPITLGPRILRAETAGIVAIAAILYELGDLELVRR
jgi:16S rRNA (uracil1498-N3)-methyltransferase